MSKKLVVITGASSGIGHETAIFLADHNYAVIACARSPNDTLTARPNIVYRQCDITRQSDVEQLGLFVEERIAQQPGLDSLYLINNAGISPVNPLEAVDKDEFDEVFLTNTYAPLRLIQTLLPFMKSVPSRIVNISSGAGVMAIPLNGVYSMSKFALEAMSDVLRVELKQFDIQTVVVEPGLINSSIHRKTLDGVDRLDPAVRLAYRKQLQCSVVKQSEDAKFAASPVEVSKVIKHAMEVRRPAARYGAGKDAVMLRRIHWLLGDRLRDFIVTRRGGW